MSLVDLCQRLLSTLWWQYTRVSFFLFSLVGNECMFVRRTAIVPSLYVCMCVSVCVFVRLCVFSCYFGSFF